MELRRAAQAVTHIRSISKPLNHSPASPSRIALPLRIRAATASITSSQTQCRSINTSTTRDSAANPQPKDTAGEASPSTTSSSSASTPTPQERDTPPPRTRNRPLTNTPAPAPSSTSTPAANNSAIRDLLSRMERSTPKPPTPEPTRNRDALLLSPDAFSFSSLTSHASRAQSDRHLQPAPFRISSSLGRAVNVNPGRSIDLGRALKHMDILVAKNRIRATFNRQRFYERGGLKRKRLRRERWRRRFMADFRAVARRVGDLRRQGW